MTDYPTVRVSARLGTPARRLALCYCAAVLTLLVVANLARLIGWDPTVVLSGSMQPALRPGDVVLLAPAHDSIAVGDIVAVRAPDKPGGSYLHRVIGATTAGSLLTRGDANTRPDFPPVDPRDVKGRVRLVLPLIGKPHAALMHGNPGPLLLASWPGLLAARMPARRRRRRRTNRAVQEFQKTHRESTIAPAELTRDSSSCARAACDVCCSMPASAETSRSPFTVTSMAT